MLAKFLNTPPRRHSGKASGSSAGVPVIARRFSRRAIPVTDTLVVTLPGVTELGLVGPFVGYCEWVKQKF